MNLPLFISLLFFSFQLVRCGVQSSCDYVFAEPECVIVKLVIKVTTQIMRITVVFEDTRLSLDVRPSDKVRTIKNIVHKKLLVDTMDDKRVGKYLEMRFGGAALQDEWVLQDLCIVSGSVVKCLLKTVEKPKLRIFLAYNEETLSILDDINPLTMLVSELRSLLSKRLGLPVSIFQLFHQSSPDDTNELQTQEQSTHHKVKVELYDSNTLDFYGVELGSTLRLDLWDGWRELIVSAISGHDKTVRNYFSWDKSVRSFQYRVVLYIAAHFGHMGLSADMIKRGAKAHEAVGTHPTRKWCHQSEHRETQKCPIHVVCERGHLSIVRLFIKSSPLCFVAKDDQERTPIQITLRHRHRNCFEYLIVRQWGRKIASDISLPIIIYCRTLQWCERAKARALLKYGTGKSSYKGIPPKVGALVGAGVLVDGYSKKPANSLSFDEVPKPAIPSGRVLPAIALVKQRFRNRQLRQSSTKSLVRQASTTSSVGRTQRTHSHSSKPLTAAASSSRQLSSVTCATESKVSFSYEREMRRCGNKRKNKSKGAVLQSVSNTSQVESSNSLLSAQDLQERRTSNRKSERNHELETDNSSELTDSHHSFGIPRRESRISFKTTYSPTNDDPFSTIDTAEERQEESVYTSTSSLPYFRPQVKRVKAIPHKPKPKETAIPLPAVSRECQLKPFFYWPSQAPVENPVHDTMSKFESYRGSKSRQHAVQCLEMTSEFTEKRWLQQLRMAVSLSRRGVKKKVLISVTNDRPVFAS